MIKEDLTTLKNLNEMVRYGAENFGERNFLEYKNPDGTIAAKTYSQFKASCDSACLWLTEKDLDGTHVALVGPTSFEWITGYFSAAMTGGAAVPLAPSETDEMNCRLMEFADVSVFAFDKKHESLYKLAKETVGSIKLFISLDNTASDKDVINFNDLLSLSGDYTGDPRPRYDVRHRVHLRHNRLSERRYVEPQKYDLQCNKRSRCLPDDKNVLLSADSSQLLLYGEHHQEHRPGQDRLRQ